MKGIYFQKSGEGFRYEKEKLRYNGIIAKIKNYGRINWSKCYGGQLEEDIYIYTSFDVINPFLWVCPRIFLYAC